VYRIHATGGRKQEKVESEVADYLITELIAWLIF